MNILNVNLIPRKRLAARRVRACLRWWAVFSMGYVVFVGGVSALVITATTPQEDPHTKDAAGTAVQIASVKDRLAQSRAELTAITRRLAGAREVQGHPDWSVLLNLIAAKRGEGLALASLELLPAGEGGGGGTGRPMSYSLRLTGLGKDHTQIAEFALRLEQAGLFSQVVLKDTAAKQLATRSVVSFGIECSLREGPGIAGAEK
ncbi:MAG: PilN domain-containing protein [Pyrinomonadaceae bacterium]|nr:PilN domain-containing protein [Phycisphaerales bacterium]